MARYFKEQDIDEFRDCFFLNSRNGTINSVDELTVIMRSLGFSPTSTELKRYFKSKGGKISFADFLDIMHTQSEKEKGLSQDILRAFRAIDRNYTGTVNAKELRRILTQWGEKLTAREVDRLFRDINANPNGSVKYDDIIRVLCAPVPDY